jgi:uncharacterized protein YciI
MFYAFIATDTADSDALRAEHRSPHLERIMQLVDEGRLLTSGPFPAADAPDPGTAGVTGSLIVAEFDSLEKAQTWGHADPFYQAGIWQDLVIKPYLNRLP